MELNTTYDINIISQIDKDLGIFIVVEKFNSHSTKYFQNYFKQLLKFNDCSEWFENFDYPIIETGQAVIVQVDKKPWARGIISEFHNDKLYPEIYLIDSQRHTDKGHMIQLRTCPSKFLQLIVPTYYIKVDICLNDDDLKAAITILLKKNQYGELSFRFIPQSFENNIYSGVLSVNLKVNNLNIPLKKLLKNVHTKKIFEDIPQYKNYQNSIFNPLKLKHLKNIFIPREPSNIVFLEDDQVSSSYISSVLNDSITNLSYNSANELSLNSNYSENICISDDSELEVQKLEIGCNTPITKQNVYSSNCSLMSKSSSSLPSLTSNNNNYNNSLMSEIKQSNDFIMRISELKDIGCNQAELKDIGCKQAELKDIGCEQDELNDNGCKQADVSKLN
ncbi:uncharacterized protein LOC112603757 [Melanaphis sacchari]|uniref:uncharacterized protein LOC112603757 n=1 Tax=Melanaphis sacchari TaxID=742174 RepID=UPI000DC13CFF|nr:uncharacterized protein LOC112603757 [Melanaphis sacchari]